ncbi:MAG: formylglycine-rating enzyme family protein [Ferruginibacter sp.]|uniref:formylglycine-generating enzyme family protein n=1 Tax=Ferruginibacter sp. TaxID=1940288 RepID=UPI00265996AF|nr:formylglycine-generating enzyme family protein [Ferruginibacter sp.]MDB5280479.1 formylglycine-rating enzyme family protein [Ferruginibacter sp.]
MKKLLILLFTSVTCQLAAAQDSVKLFVTYKFSIPGSTLQCKMVPIEAGNFLMGSAATEKDHAADEGPQHKVSVSAFWMGAYEVTRDEFDVFYKDETTSENSAVDAVTRPSPQYIDLSWGMGKEGGYPVNSMSQFAALMYCKWLYTKTGVFYRLPTEAEWEYACRAGTTTRYYFGNDEKQLDNYAWYEKNSDGKFQKVGMKLPNAWGLYDMLGNVCEWTLDHYDAKRMEALQDNTKDPATEPNTSKYPKVLRGGGFADEAGQLRSATRYKSDASWNRRDPQIPKSKWWLTDASAVGFRIVCPLEQPTPAQALAFYKTYIGR